MPVPSAISELSQTPGSNYPAGSESPSTADDYFRTYAAFIATLRDGAGYTAEATVASAATADIGAAASLYVAITGTTTITSFGANYNGPRFIRFAGSLTLTHNASSLILPGGANITTAAGDTAIVVPQSAGWRVVSYTRAATPMTGSIIDRAYAEYTTNASLTTTIPNDDTIPQNTEGTQILSVSLTPKSTTSRVRLRFSGQVAAASAVTVAAAMFSSASANALRATMVTTGGTDQAGILAMEYEYVPGTTSALTYSVRVGPFSAITVRMNGSSGGRNLGGAHGAVLVVEEISA